MGIIFTDAYVAPQGDQRLLTRAPSDAIARLTFRHGFQAPHMVIQIAFAAALILFGVALIVPQVRAFATDRHVSMLMVFVTPFPLLVGGWLFLDAFRRGWYLVVEGTQRRWRFACKGKAASEELRSVCARLSTQFGWEVSVDDR